MLRLEKQRLKHEDLRSHTIRITQIISPRESSQQLRKQKDKKCVGHVPVVLASVLVPWPHSAYMLSCVPLWRPHGLSPASLLCPWVLRAGLLEWVAIPSSRGSSWPREQTCVSCGSCIGRRILYPSSHLGSLDHIVLSGKYETTH